MAGLEPQDDAPRVFISYSRKDSAAAEALRDALRDDGFEAYLDKHDIQPGEAWRDRLSGLIAAAEKVVFLISPDAAASKICAWEVEEAERQGKSILPVVIRDTAPETLPGRLTRLNFIFYRTLDEQRAGFPALTRALTTDLAWEREKTRLNDQAEAWRRADRPARLLLSLEEAIRAAETWRDQRPPTAPAPTETQRAFIAASRAHRTRRRRQTRLGLSAAALIIALSGAAAWISRNQALEQEQIAQRSSDLAEQRRLQAEQQTARAEAEQARAEAEQARAQENQRRAAEQRRAAQIDDSRRLADRAEQALQAGKISDAIAYARAALPSDIAAPPETQDRPLIQSPFEILRKAFPLLREQAALRGHTGAINGALELPDGQFLTWSRDGSARIWGAGGAPGPVLPAHKASVSGAVVLAGGRIATWSAHKLGRASQRSGQGSGQGYGDGKARIWGPDGGLIAELPHYPVQGAVAASDGSLVTFSAKDARVWSPDGAEIAAHAFDKRLLQGVVPLEDGRLAVWGRNRLTLWRPGAPAAMLYDNAGCAHPYQIDGLLAPPRDISGMKQQRLLAWGEEAFVSCGAGRAPQSWRSEARVWNLDRGGERHLRRPDEGPRYDSGEISGALALADGRLLFWGERTLRVWTDDDQDGVTVLQGHEHRLEGAIAVDDDRVLSWGGGEGIFWEFGLSIGKQNAKSRILRRDGITGALPLALVERSLGIDLPEFVTWDQAGRMRVWHNAPVSLSRVEPRLELAGHEAPLRGARQLSDGRLLTWSADGSARLWDLRTDAEIEQSGQPRTAPEDDVALVGWADTVLSALAPLTVPEQCAARLAPEAACELVGDEIYRLEIIGALQARGAAWRDRGDPRGDTALSLAAQLSKETAAQSNAPPAAEN